MADAAWADFGTASGCSAPPEPEPKLESAAAPEVARTRRHFRLDQLHAEAAELTAALEAHSFVVLSGA
eukprot:SAG11_NODE_6371_length_1327_cov_1.305375_1_plen_68_part_00